MSLPYLPFPPCLFLAPPPPHPISTSSTPTLSLPISPPCLLSTLTPPPSTHTHPPPLLPWSPWYNRTGWLGVKHQLTYLLLPWPPSPPNSLPSTLSLPYPPPPHPPTTLSLCCLASLPASPSCTLSLQDAVDQFLAGRQVRGVKRGLLGELAPVPGGAGVLQ